VQSNQVWPAQEADCAFHDAKLLGPKEENHYNSFHQLPELKAKCTKFDVDWDSAPDPARAAYSAPPDVLPEFKGTYV